MHTHKYGHHMHTNIYLCVTHRLRYINTHTDYVQRGLDKHMHHTLQDYRRMTQVMDSMLSIYFKTFLVEFMSNLKQEDRSRHLFWTLTT